MLSVDYLVLADAAAAVEGRHYIHGAGWDTLFAASFPVVHPSMSVAVRLRIPWTDTNRPYTMELDVVDADARSILLNPPGPAKGTVNVGRPPHLEPGNDQVLCLAFNLVGLQFQQSGTYAVIFTLDDREAARAPFQLALVPGGAR